MIRPVKVSCVSYSNSAPFIFGLRNHEIINDIILTLDTPADCAAKLNAGIVDIGLIPVAALLTNPRAEQITDWCIGATGPVKSVTLLSHVPLEQIKNVLLDFQSMTSNLLCRILAAQFWNINPVFMNTIQGFENNINGTTAGVVIGDRSLQMQNKFPFIYDLAGEWFRFTGLPFVFARWACNMKPESDFLEKFNSALAYGTEKIDEVIDALKNSNDYAEGIDSYLKNNISYNFDEKKKMGLQLFLAQAGSISPVYSGR